MATNNYNHNDVVGIDLVKNVIDTYFVVAAKPEQYKNGILWYATAHKFVFDLSVAYGKSLQHMAGIVAALSPQLSWERNKICAVKFCAGMANSTNVMAIGATGPNIRKAIRIWNGENALDVLGGMKVISFYHNLLLIDTHVTVDRHAASIAMFGDNGEKSGSIALSDKLYVIIADAYRKAAAILGYDAYILQAIVWTQKAQKGGKA